MAPQVSRSVTISACFFVLLAGLVLLDRLTWMALPWYLGLSVVTFVAYVRDKAAAERNRWRVMERTLQFLAFLGGWPGAWIAQQMLRHKTSKRSFQIEFWICVIVNLVVLAALIWQGGQLSSSAALPHQRHVPAELVATLAAAGCAGRHDHITE
jgi:uncharacterized membrane protein YsdA (DUF1294 family)